jgi:hypothetical protein
MNRDEAIRRLCGAFGKDPSLADFNIVAVNHVLDLLIQTEREACAKEADKWSKRDDDVGAFIGKAIRARGQA